MTGYGQTVTDFGTPLTVSTGTSTQTVLVPYQVAGKASSIRVVTAGIAGQDFTTTDEGTCATGTFLVGQSCSISVTFSPKAPGERVGAVVVLNGTTVLGTQLLHGRGTGALGVFLPGTITTVAGNLNWIYAGDGGDALSSPIFFPSGIAVDPAGNVYLSDTNNNRIRMVNAISHVITTVAGNGSAGLSGDGGPGINAAVSLPTALVLNGAGDLYIADSSNHAIRKLTLATGILSTVAGQLGVQGSTGDGGPATLALFNNPSGLAMDASGDLYISDSGNNTIRKLDPSGIVTLVAGTPTVAGFAGDGGPATASLLSFPQGLAINAGGDLYIADSTNQRVRKISANGNISTVVGTGIAAYSGDGGPATSAAVSQPQAVAVDVAGNLYVADSSNDLIRKVSATTGLISNIVGFPLSTNLGGDNGPANLATIQGSSALTLDSVGNLYLSDLFHNRIRKISNSYATLKYTPIRVGRTSAPQSQTFENDGNAALTFTAIAPDQNTAVDSGTTSCVISVSLNPNDTCVVGAEFKPQTVGAVVTGDIQLQSNASNSPGIIHLTGEADELEPTTVALQTSGSPSAFGAAVTFTATMKGGLSTPPTGTVTFLDGGSATIGVGTLNSAGVATLTISTLALGSHDITAHYGGDEQNAPSTSGVVTQVVKQGPSVVLTTSPNPSLVGDSVSLTATVTTSSIQPSGLVTFKDGVTTLGSRSLNGSGVAIFATTALAAGSHSITASYVGDTNTLPGSSTVTTQVVNKWTTTTLLSSSGSPSDVGTPVTFTITVTPTSTTIPTGSVTLQDGAAVIATKPLVDGSATFTTSTLTVGSHLLVARFAGDATNDASGSSTFTQVVRQIATDTTLQSSANPADGGATIRFTATVTATTNATAGAVSGTVTFKEGATTLGIVTLSSGGVATVDVKTLSVGTHPITATYSGNTNYATSISSTLNQVVQLATTTSTLSSSVNPSIAGSSVTLTAVVTGNGGIPTGTVTFFDGATSIGTGPIGASGQATLVVSNLSTGSHSLTASYGGDAKDNPSTSAPYTQVVKQATTALTLTSSGSPAFLGTQVTFVATLTSNGTIPAGQPIVLTENGAVLGSIAMDATGVARFMLNTLTAGSHNLVASYAGDVDHTASNSAVLVQVMQAATSSAAISSSQNPSTFGDSITFVATITGTGTQTTGNAVFLDGGAVIATVPLNGSSVATFTTSTLSIGSHTISVNYAGDATHSGAAPASLIQRVLQATSTAIISSQNPALVGATVRFTATVSGASGTVPAGTVAFTDGGTTLGSSALNSAGIAILDVSTLGAGTHLIVATYSGDANDKVSTSPALSQAINTADTTVTLSSSANPSVVGAPVTFTASIVSTGRSANGPVSFLEGSTVLGNVNAVNGTARFTTSTLIAGQHAIIARYGGDSGTQVSTSNVLLQVEQQTTTASLSSNINPALTLQAITLTATVANGANATGVVTFRDGSAIIGSVALDATGTASLVLPSLSAGTHNLSASYGGDNYNLPSTTNAVSEVVQLRPTTISTTASSSSYLAGQQVTLVGVIHWTGPVTPTGTVTFTSGGATLGTVQVSTAGAATLIFFPQNGSYNIVATYNGDSVYSPSIAASYNISAGASTTFSITANPTTVSVATGEHVGVDVTIVASKSFTDTLAFGCLDMPLDATCTFDKTSMDIAGGGTSKIHLVFDTGNPLGAGATAKLEPRRVSRVTEAGILLPFAALFGFLLFTSRRRRSLPALLSLAVLVLAGLGVTGCANKLQMSTTPAGTYTVRIMASGLHTTASQIADLSVTVR